MFITGQDVAQLVGRTLPSVTFPVESSKIREFARATFNDGRGLRATPADEAFTLAPLTYSVVSRLYADGDAMALVHALMLDPARAVHGEQAWEYHSPMRAGQSLTGTPTVVAAVAKTRPSGGESIVVTVETVFADAESGIPVVTERMVTIQLPEGPPAASVAIPLNPDRLRLDPDGPVLLGSRCGECELSYFPRRWLCGVDMTPLTDVELSREGVIHVATFVHVPREGAQGYGVAEVDLPEGVRIQCVILGDPSSWRQGTPVRLVTERVGPDKDGQIAVNYRFAPVE